MERIMNPFNYFFHEFSGIFCEISAINNYFFFDCIDSTVFHKIFKEIEFLTFYFKDSKYSTRFAGGADGAAVN